MTPTSLILVAPLLLIALLLGASNPTQAEQPKKLRNATRGLPGPRAQTGAKESCPDFVIELAEKWGQVFDVPREWICSQAFVESTNDPSKKNRKSGAMGLLQVMPLTAVWHIEKLKRLGNSLIKNTIARLWKGRTTDLLNPDLNVMIAAAHMKFLQNIFGDNHDLVAAAYDAGHNKILRLLREGKPLPAESRLYIAMVHEAKLRGYV
jgi:soluble lytic murein transglycosylase-like protein